MIEDFLGISQGQSTLITRFSEIIKSLRHFYLFKHQLCAERWPQFFEQHTRFYKWMPALGLSCHG